jgi:hypothetical protein
VSKYLLDSDVVSELRKPRPHGAVVAWISAQNGEHLFVSTVTIGKLQSRIERTRRHDSAKASQLEVWLAELPAIYQCLPMDIACFREWARLMNLKPDFSSEDAMIAATARVHSLVVVTRNERDFAHFDVRVLNPFKS